jgi:quinol monooxygenase YgiN
MSKDIQSILQATIEEGRIEEFKRLVGEITRAVDINEPGTKSYRYYLNDDETKCVISESYVNSEAALAHLNGAAAQTILPKIFNISKINRFEVFGDPSKELQEALTKFGSQNYHFFAGFTR